MFVYLPVSGCVALLVVHGKLNKSSSSLHQELESLVPCCSTYLAVYARQLKTLWHCFAQCSAILWQGSIACMGQSNSCSERMPTGHDKACQLSSVLTGHVQWWRHLVLRHTHRQLPPWWKLAPQGKARRLRQRERRGGVGERKIQQRPRRP